MNIDPSGPAYPPEYDDDKQEPRMSHVSRCVVCGAPNCDRWTYGNGRAPEHAAMEQEIAS